MYSHLDRSPVQCFYVLRLHFSAVSHMITPTPLSASADGATSTAALPGRGEIGSPEEGNGRGGSGGAAGEAAGEAEEAASTEREDNAIMRVREGYVRSLLRDIYGSVQSFVAQAGILFYCRLLDDSPRILAQISATPLVLLRVV